MNKKLLLLHLSYIHSKDSTSYYRETCISMHYRETCISMLITVFFKIARNKNQLKCPLTDKWIMTIWCIYTMHFHSFIGKT